MDSIKDDGKCEEVAFDVYQVLRTYIAHPSVIARHEVIAIVERNNIPSTKVGTTSIKQRHHGVSVG